MTRYFTFGFDHVHEVGGFTFDHNVLVRITAEDPRAEMVAMFGTRWSMEYDEPPAEKYWPRGMRDLSPAVAVEPVPVPSDADRLRGVMDDCRDILEAVVGKAAPSLDEGWPARVFDPQRRVFPLVAREEVPEVLWRGAIVALDVLSVALDFTDERSASTEPLGDQVEAWLRGRKP